jgi:hypothetical protein
MTPERWQQLDQLLKAALNRPPAERAAFLAEQCARDQDLLRDAERLLTAQHNAGSFLEAPPYAWLKTLRSPRRPWVHRGRLEAGR